MATQNNIVTLKHKAPAPDGATTESVVAEIASLSNKYLYPLVNTLFDKADNTLFDMAEKAENNTQQAHYFDTMRELRLVRTAIEEAFQQRMSTAFAEVFTPAAPAAQQESSERCDREPLSLVDDEKLEEALAIKGMAEKIRNHEQKSIDALDKRFAHLLTAGAETSIPHPIAPEAICEAFRDALQVMETELSIRLIIYKLFDLNVVSNLGPFYEAVNGLMIKAGILSELPKPRFDRTAGTPVHPRQAAQRSTDTTVEDTAAHSPPGIGNDDAESSLLGALQTLLGSPASSGLIPIQPGAMIDNGTGISPVRPEQLLTGLTGLQQGDIHGSGRAIDSTTLKSRLAGALKGGSESGVAGFQHRESLFIDVVAMLFDFILEDSAIPDVAKAQIGRLQIPMVKAALIDENFLAKRSHPARQLLNQLAQASSSLDRNATDDSALLNEIGRVVTTITAEFENDMQIFARELQRLETFLEQQRQEEQRVQGLITDAKSRQENEELTRARVDEVIRIKLAMAETASPVQEIIQKSWRQVLLHTGRTHGTDSTLWRQRGDYIGQLIDSLQPREGGEARRTLMQSIPQLVATLRGGMLEAGFNEEAIGQTLKVIEPMHLAIISPAAADSKNTGEELKKRAIENAIHDMQQEMANLDDLLENLDGSLLTPDPLGEEIHSLIPEELIEDIVLATEEGMTPEDLPDDEYITTIRNMEVGQLVILRDRDNNPVRCKLSWKSELLGEYIFTNWRHKVVAERTLNGLAGDLYQGRVELVDQAPILERAMEKVLGGLRQQQSGGGAALSDELPA